MRTLACLFVTTLCLPALAQQPEPAAATFEVLELKTTSNIENREPVDNMTTFTTGARAYLWMKVKPSGDGAQLQIKYSVDGNHVWTMDPVAVRLGRLWYYKTLHVPGAWKAEIMDGTGKLIRDVSFTVTGEPVGPAAAARPDPAAGATTGESTHLSVVDLKLAGEIKDREPLNPGNTFTTGAKVYAWIKLQVKDPETQVRLRWNRPDKSVYTSDPVTVRQSNGWRTWLYKTVTQTGAWKVEVIDTDNKIVHTTDFTVN